MPNPTPELPEDIRSTIYQQAKDYSQVTSLDDSEPRYNELKRIGFIEGAFHYAALYLNSERRRKEAMELLEPILDWGQGNPELKLGTSITREVLERAKGFSVLRDALEAIYNLPGCRQDEASQLASEALALFPVDKNNHDAK